MVVDTAASGGNVFEDLSGVSSNTSGNPYDALLSLCQNDQVASISFLLDFLLQLLVLRLLMCTMEHFMHKSQLLHEGCIS